jgi:hypothetical protein
MDRTREQQVRIRLRHMLETGEIPCEEPQKLWAGRGTGLHCVACGETIPPTELEYEIDLRSGTLRVHRVCHDLWLDECESHRPHASGRK